MSEGLSPRPARLPGVSDERADGVAGEHQGGGERVWVLEAEPDTGRVDQDELAQKMVDAAVVVGTVGGILTIAPHRVPVPGRRGQFETRSVLFRWHSYVPTARTHEAPETPQEPPRRHPQELVGDGDGPADPIDTDALTEEELEQHFPEHVGGDDEEPVELSDEEAAQLGRAPVELEA